MIYDTDDNRILSAAFAIRSGEVKTVTIKIDCLDGYQLSGQVVGDLVVEARHGTTDPFSDIENFPISLSTWDGSNETFEIRFTAGVISTPATRSFALTVSRGDIAPVSFTLTCEPGELIITGQEITLTASGVPFEDDFDDNSIDGAKWATSAWLGTSQTGVTITEASQQLTITPATSSAGNHYNSLLSVPSLDFQDKTFECDFVSYPNLATNANCGIEIVKASDSSKYVRALTSISTMQMQASSPSNTGFVTIDAPNMTKWRIKHISASNTWEFYSYDGSWNLERTSSAQNWTPNDVKIRILAGTFDSVATPGVFTVDNLITDATY